MKKELYTLIQNNAALELIGFDGLPVFLETKTFHYEWVEVQYLDLEKSIKSMLIEFVRNDPSQLDKVIQVVSFIFNCVQGYNDLDIIRKCCTNKLTSTVIKKKNLNRTFYGHVVLAPLIIEELQKNKAIDQILLEYQFLIPKTRDCINLVKVVSYDTCNNVNEIKRLKAPIDVYLIPILKEWDENIIDHQLKRNFPINWHFLIGYYTETRKFDSLVGLIKKIKITNEHNTSSKVSFSINESSKIFDFLFFEYKKIIDLNKKNQYEEILNYLFKQIILKIFNNNYDRNFKLASSSVLDHSHINGIHLRYISESLFAYFILNQSAIINTIKIPLLNWSIFFETIGIRNINQLKRISDYKNNKIKHINEESSSRFNFWTVEPELELFIDKNFKSNYFNQLSFTHQYSEFFIDFIFLLRKTVPDLDQQLLIPYIQKNTAESIMAELSSELWSFCNNVQIPGILGFAKLFNVYEHKKMLRIMLKTHINSNIFMDTLNMFYILSPEEYPIQSSFSSIHELHERLKIIQLKKNTKVKELNQIEIIAIDNSEISINNEKYKVRVPKTNYDLIIGGELLNNCVGIYNYTDKIISKTSFVIFIEKNNELYACIELLSCLKIEEWNENGEYITIFNKSSKTEEYLSNCYITIQSVLWGNKSWSQWPREQYILCEKNKIKFIKRQDIF